MNGHTDLRPLVLQYVIMAHPEIPSNAAPIVADRLLKKHGRSFADYTRDCLARGVKCAEPLRVYVRYRRQTKRPKINPVQLGGKSFWKVWNAYCVEKSLH